MSEVLRQGWAPYLGNQQTTSDNSRNAGTAQRTNKACDQSANHIRQTDFPFNRKSATLPIHTQMDTIKIDMDERNKESLH